MNLGELRTIEAAAAPAPWLTIPVIYDRLGTPVINAKNEHLIRTLRNISPELLQVLGAVNEMARAFNVMQTTVVDGQPTASTAEAVHDYQGACIGALQAQDRLYGRMALL